VDIEGNITTNRASTGSKQQFFLGGRKKMTISTKSRMKSILAVVIALAILATMWVPVNAAAAPNSFEGYIQIHTAEEFARIGRAASHPLNARYVLMANIDLRSLSTGTGNNVAMHRDRGWLGIGPTVKTPNPLTAAGVFTGTLDGNGHTISGLWMNRTSLSAQMGNHQGLFRVLRGAEVRNLTIELDSRGIIGNADNRGALAGTAVTGTVIENVHVIGNGARVGATSGSSDNHGGIVGSLRQSTIRNSTVADVHVIGNSHVGGVVGAAHENSKKNRRKKRPPLPSDMAGIENVTATNVRVEARRSYVGGIAGDISDGTTVRNVHVVGANVRAGTSYAGGFAGLIGNGSEVTHSSARGSVVVNAGSRYAGGFVGAVESVQKRAGQPVRLYRVFAGTWNNFAQVSATERAGGLIGILSDNSNVSVSNSYASVNVRRAYAGGLVGAFELGSISNAYAHGTVTVRETGNHTSSSGGIGGLIGNIDTGKKPSSGRRAINNTYANVRLVLQPAKYSMTLVGGLAGRQGSTNLQVNGTNFFDEQTIAASTRGNAAAPAMLATGSQDGLSVAVRRNLLNNTQAVAARPTAQMHQQSNFVGWDFSTVWTMNSPHNYPVFQGFGQGGQQTHEVRFNVNFWGEFYPATDLFTILNVANGGTLGASMPAAPSHPFDFEFAGWFLDYDSFDRPFTADTVITGPTQVFGLWNFVAFGFDAELDSGYFVDGGAPAGNDYFVDSGAPAGNDYFFVEEDAGNDYYFA